MNAFADPSMVWPCEFAEVISCQTCTNCESPQLLRDAEENVPQPGYIGSRYLDKRVLLVGQNPAAPPERLAAEDRPYTAALRELRDGFSVEAYSRLQCVLRCFIPRWPVHGLYFPLEECGLTLEDIAYFNFVRCRTVGNRTPSVHMTTGCSAHFDRWLRLLEPRVVVFIGKWAHDRAREGVGAHGIPFTFVNRQRSLSREERIRNRNDVVALVQQATASGPELI